MHYRLIAAFFFAVLSLTEPTAAAAQDKQVPQSREQINLSFAPVVRAVAPTVVNIYSKRIVRERAITPLFDDPFFRRFFGKSFGLSGPSRERVQNSLGSGVIVSPDGLIVTSQHVIEGATQITVVLSDRREFEAEIVLTEERTDLAVLRIDPGHEALPSIDLRDSDELEVGDLVLAIGNPFGVGQTVTSGIVSGLARTQVGVSDYSFFIQTDAAINPGNSGGALVTLDGKLIGINTAIYSRSGGSIGIGFAIPSDMVRTVIASAMNGGKLVRPWPGFVGQTLTAELAEAFGLERPGGVIVRAVYPSGPADRAGLRPGDIIRGFDGQPVDDVEAMRFRVATAELGRRARLDVWRDGKSLSPFLPLNQPPETPPRERTLLNGRHPLAGAVVANLSPVLSQELDLPGAWEGVIVLEVARGSPAHQFEVRPGDIVVAMNDRRIGRVADLKKALTRAAGHWKISVSREGRVRTFEIVA